MQYMHNARKAMSVRTTISLPDELKARMDAVEEPVNWSAEAAKCFEQLLGTLAAKKREKNMSDVIARLRASKIESDDKEERFAFEAGASWATDEASYAELKRAVRFLEANSEGGYWDAYGLPVYAACAILGEEDDRDVGQRFWEQIGIELIQEHYEDDSFVMGFLEGAKSIWDKVEDKI